MAGYRSRNDFGHGRVPELNRYTQFGSYLWIGHFSDHHAATGRWPVALECASLLRLVRLRLAHPKSRWGTRSNICQTPYLDVDKAADRLAVWSLDNLRQQACALQ